MKFDTVLFPRNDLNAIRTPGCLWLKIYAVRGIELERKSRCFAALRIPDLRFLLITGHDSRTVRAELKTWCDVGPKRNNSANGLPTSSV